MIHRFTEELESMTVGDPIVEARLLRSLAAALTGVGDYTTAKKKIMAAIRLLKKHVGPDQVETVAAELQSDRLTLLQAAPKIAKKWLAETAARDNPARRHDAQ